MQVAQCLKATYVAYVDSYSLRHLAKLPENYLLGKIKDKLQAGKVYFRPFVEGGRVVAATIRLLYTHQQAAELCRGCQPIIWHAFQYSSELRHERVTTARADVHLEVVQLQLDEVLCHPTSSLATC